MLKNRLALVTGATGGIGRAICHEFARQGAHIIALGRQATALQQLDDEILEISGNSATLVPMDLRKHDGIDVLGHTLYERFGKLDIFVGNAGILGPISPVGHIPPKKWDELLAVNLTANFRFIRSFEPLFKKSDAARLTFVSSGVARRYKSFWSGYATTKAGLEMLALTYAEEMKNSHIKVNCLNPGPIRTKMRAEAMPGEDPETLPTPEQLAPLVAKMSSPDYDKTGHLEEFSAS